MTAFPSLLNNDSSQKLTELQDRIQSELKHTRPGEPNFNLMATVCKLVEHVGQHPELASEVTESIRAWLQQDENGARPVYYRKIDLLRRSEFNYEQRQGKLLEGARLLGINPSVVLNAPPREPTEARSLCLA